MNSIIDINTYLFQSERLGFRNWRHEDRQPFAKMNADSMVMEFFPSILTKEESDYLMSRLSSHFDKYKYTFFAVDALESQQFIGFIGIINSAFEADFTPCIEIGWRLQQSSWGKGYATEGAKRCLEYGFKELKFPSIYSVTPLSNKKSERVMQKIGMVKHGEFSHPKIEKGHILEQHVAYRIQHER